MEAVKTRTKTWEILTTSQLALCPERERESVCVCVYLCVCPRERERE